MQPYLFPYLGYFQLIHAVDHFVFYDDVQFIKSGWINRNRILHAGKELLFTMPLDGSQTGQEIRDVFPTKLDNWSRKFHRTIQQNYGKSPNYKNVSDMLLAITSSHEGKSIADIAIASVEAVLRYLGLERETVRSSEAYPDTRHSGRVQRIIEIARKTNCTSYVNSIGGRELYSKLEFSQHDIELWFVRPRPSTYNQFGQPHVPGLSIIDVLMHCSPDEIRELLKQYDLE